MFCWVAEAVSEGVGVSVGVGVGVVNNPTWVVPIGDASADFEAMTRGVDVAINMGTDDIAEGVTGSVGCEIACWVVGRGATIRATTVGVGAIGDLEVPRAGKSDLEPINPTMTITATVSQIRRPLERVPGGVLIRSPGKCDSTYYSKSGDVETGSAPVTLIKSAGDRERLTPRCPPLTYIT